MQCTTAAMSSTAAIERCASIWQKGISLINQANGASCGFVPIVSSRLSRVEFSIFFDRLNFEMYLRMHAYGGGVPTHVLSTVTFDCAMRAGCYLHLMYSSAYTSRCLASLLCSTPHGERTPLAPKQVSRPGDSVGLLGYRHVLRHRISFHDRLQY